MSRQIEIMVGFFMVIAICSVLFLCFRVTDVTTFNQNSTYRVYAIFDNVGGLKARSPIKIGGVVIGRIANITLKDYKPYVSMDIDSNYNRIPGNSSLSIKTSGLLGEQFIAVSLGIAKSDESDLDLMDAKERGINEDKSINFEEKIPAYFEEGFVIHNTSPAMVIEDLIGQFLFSAGSSKDKMSTTKQPNN